VLAKQAGNDSTQPTLVGALLAGTLGIYNMATTSTLDAHRVRFTASSASLCSGYMSALARALIPFLIQYAAVRTFPPR